MQVKNLENHSVINWVFHWCCCYLIKNRKMVELICSSIWTYFKLYTYKVLTLRKLSSTAPSFTTAGNSHAWFDVGFRLWWIFTFDSLPDVVPEGLWVFSWNWTRELFRQMNTAPLITIYKVKWVCVFSSYLHEVVSRKSAIVNHARSMLPM